MMATCLGTPRPSRIRPRRWRAFAAGLLTAAVWLASPSPAAAQSAVGGIVKDANGRVVVGARVTVRQESSGREWRTASSSIGSYEIAPLPPGPYTVRVDSEFYDTFVGKVELIRHRMARLDVGLEVRITEELTVQAPHLPPEPLATRDLSIGTTFTREALESLPLTNGRTVQSVLVLVPGIVATDSVGTLAQFTAAGQRRLANRMTIDGVSADLAIDVSGPGGGAGSVGNLPAFATSGGTQTLVPMAAIDEITVRTTSASPEHATAPGAITSIVTRSGGNTLTGTAFADSRPDALAASSWLVNAGRWPERRVDFWTGGASAGGPLAPGRLFFFSTFERQSLDRPVTMTVPVPSMGVRERANEDARRLLDAFPRPNTAQESGDFGEYTGTVPAASRLWTLSNRFDWTVNSRHKLFGRVNVGRSSGDPLSAFGQLPFVSSRQTERTSTDTFTLGLDSTSSSRHHQLRMNFSVHGVSSVSGPSDVGGAGTLPLDLLVPGASSRGEVVGVALYPGDTGFAVQGPLGETEQRQFQLADTWSWVSRRHEWRFGVDYRRIDREAIQPSRRYIFRLNNLTNLLNGRIPQPVVLETATARLGFQSLALFAQDMFRPTPRLTLSYGARYRIQTTPHSGSELAPLLVRYETLPEIETFTADSLWRSSWKNLSGRVVLAYQLNTQADREMTLRTGWGVAFDDTSRPASGSAALGRPYTTSYFLPSLAFPVPPGGIPSSTELESSSEGTSEYYSFPEQLRSPRTHEWHLAIERALGRNQRVSVSYAGAAGRDLFYWHSYYLQPRTQRVNAYSNDATSSYHGLLVDYVRRLARGFQSRAVYTWSHTIDTDSGESEAPYPPPALVSPASNRGSADFDRRHVLQVSASYRVPTSSKGALWRRVVDDLQFDMVGVFRSGGPVNIRSSRSLQGDFYTLRPDLVPGVPLWLDDDAAASGHRLNPAAFKVPEEQRQGTLGRNVLRASPLRQIDLSVSRSVRLGGRTVAQFRLDAFNVLNLASFGPPFGLLRADEFGKPHQTYAEALGSGSLVMGGLPPLQQVGAPRSLQLGVRIGF